MENGKRTLIALFVFCAVLLTYLCVTTNKIVYDVPPNVISRIKSQIVSSLNLNQDPIQSTKVKSFMDKWRNTNRSLTVVTAFFDIGKFPKGGFSNMRSENTYEQWGKTFSFLQNPLVVYTDSDAFQRYFEKVRENQSESTRIIRISRNDLWPFQIVPRIKKLYLTPGYPKHYPNTYIPEYTSLTHSKQPILADAVERDYFHTDYFCWFDVGYFRDNVGRRKKFWLEVPSDFDKKKIAVTRVYHVDLDNVTPKVIILGNRNWVGGGLFLGIPSTILKFHKQYKSAVMRYLDNNLMNVEQHILYAMYTKIEREKYPLEVDLQLYIPGQQRVINTNPWFYLGYLMYREDNR
ncbi:hypothetical protein FSP39_005402 [Pinctada imbricata]|uniref:Uncharacterized protein n=1 Tax=Pinctada imbricata TaxID=66713 RepID=A0AA88XZE3_PINIB|nr:hypothetical protein FSP39_005402 [Pinctada imbricata]